MKARSGSVERGNATSSGDGQNFTARAEGYRQKNAAILSSWLPWLKPEEVGHHMLPYIRAGSNLGTGLRKLAGSSVITYRS